MSEPTENRALAVRETLAMSGGVPAVQNMAEVVSIAQLMARSGIAIRKHLREQPGACLGVALQAFRWDMDPYMVGNKSYAVNDQLAYEAQLLAAVVLTRAAIAEEPDYEYAGEPFKTRTCTVTFKMRSGKSLSYTTPETAKISPKNSPLWKTDEDQQLGYYAIRAWARRHQPHVLLGVYTPEEASEMVIDVTPKTSGVMERLSGEQNGAGFDHEHVERETDPKARVAAKRAARRAAAEAKDEAPTPEAPPADEPEREQQTAAQAADEALDGDDLPDALKGDHHVEAEEAVEEPDDDEVLPPEMQTYIEAIETAPAFADVKRAMATFFNTVTFQGMDPEQQNHVRYQTWMTLIDRKEEGTLADLPDHATDVSAFRLWIEAQGDPEAITGTLAVLERVPAFEQKDDAFKANIRNAAAARIARCV